MKYDQLIIYYFSGTGNARNAAKWIARTAEEKAVISQMVNIDRLKTGEIADLDGLSGPGRFIKPGSKTLIGFCSPTHGFNLPPLVLKFIWNFPRSTRSDVFILNTRGGLKLGKLFLPGLSGIAQIFPAIILRIKGFRIVGMQPLDLPSNWIFLHPGLREKVISSMYKRCHRIVDDFASGLLEGKRKFKALLSLPFDIAIVPVSVGYFLFGRFFLAKTLVATDDCNLCMKCINQCPVKAIKLIDDRPFWKYNCESCMRCINNCPERAIETSHLFSASLFVISALAITPMLMAGLKFIGVHELIYRSGITDGIWRIIHNILFILFVFVAYRFLHHLMRFRFFSRIIAYTSLTKYKFWRRYRPVSSTMDMNTTAAPESAGDKTPSDENTIKR